MNLEVFKNEDFGEIRTVIIEEQPWFVASDICKALDIKNTTQAVDKLDDDEKSMLNIGLSGGATNCVNEYGLYNLVLSSRKKEAKQFKRWITHEVLPAIRNTGGYINNDDLFINTYLPFADETTKALFSGTLRTIREQNQTIIELKPKADYFDNLVERNLLTNLRDTAKEIGIAPKKFNNYLLENGFLYRDAKKKLKPYQTKMTQGLFEIKEVANERFAGNQTLVTTKGRETFRLLVSEMN